MDIDYLQAALLFLIILLSFFLTVTGVQVFLILKDLKKSLDKFNQIIQIADASKEVTKEEKGATELIKDKIKSPNSKHRRFYKKIMK